jgi:hypothetical protein
MCLLSLMCLQQQKQKNFLVFLILRFILIEIIFIKIKCNLEIFILLLLT